MQLMSLGVQSRKTGIKPKSLLTKDKFDMEDIDDFFNEATWSDSPLEVKHDIPSDAAGAPKNSKLKSSLGFENNTIVAAYLPPCMESPEYDIGYIDQNIDRLAQQTINLDSQAEKKSSSVAKLHTKSICKASRQSSMTVRVSDDKEQICVLSPHTKSTMLSLIHEGNKQQIVLNESPGIFSSNININLSQMPVIENTVPDKDARVVSNQLTPPGILHIHCQKLVSFASKGLRKSKRIKIAPLAFWRNEKIVYSRAQDTFDDIEYTLAHDLHQVPLQEIFEVIHFPENSELKIKKIRRSLVRASRKARMR